jgi:RNA polymerase sigma-70 factor (ECF subfamily)
VDDLELVARARRGDHAAFGALVDRHREAVYRAALAVLGSPAEAEEAAQDALVTAYLKLDGFRGEAAFRTWLVRIAWRQALDRRRSLVRRLRRFVGLQEEEWPLLPSAERSLEQTALGRELERQVGRLLRALPARLRDPLLLLASGELSHAEVAAVLGLPEGTVKWRVAEARRQLKQRLERLGFTHA